MTDKLRTWFGCDYGATDEQKLRAHEEDPRWTTTRYLVEATDYEAYAAWCFRAKQSTWRYDRHDVNTVDWVQTAPGYNYRVGEIADHPVCVHLQWDYLDGELVCFWEASSVVVDYDMVKVWLAKKLPNVKHRTNAQNLDNALHDIREKREEEERVSTTFDSKRAYELITWARTGDWHLSKDMIELLDQFEAAIPLTRDRWALTAFRQACDDLQRITDERDALRSALVEVTEAIKHNHAQVTRWEKLLAPPAAIRVFPGQCCQPNAHGEHEASCRRPFK